MIVKNLSGIFSGAGFQKKDGRRPNFKDAGWLKGPIDLEIDATTGLIKKIQKNISSPKVGTFDGRGLFATSGFLDSHTHTLFSGTRAGEYFARWQGKSYQEIAAAGGGILNTIADTEASSDEELLAQLTDRLKNFARSGVSTVEVKTGYGKDAQAELRYLRLLKNFRESPLAKRLPRLLVTFLPLHALPKGRKEADYVREMKALLTTIQRETLADFFDAFPEVGFFSLTASLEFARAAQKAGLKLKIHADELSDMKASETFTREKAVSIDHLQKINPHALALLKKAKTVATLLPATSFYLDLAYAPARSIIEAGARFALASDFNPGTAPSCDFSFTQLLAAAKMKLQAHEILCASTFNAAAALGLEKTHGVLAKGYVADLCLWADRGLSPELSLQRLFTEQVKPRVLLLKGVPIQFA